MPRLRDQMEADLKIAGYSQGTQEIYLHHARNFANHFQRSPKDMGADEIRQYMLHLIEQRGYVRSTIRGVRAALCFLYKATLKRPQEVQGLPVPRRQKHLPIVLSGTEVAALLRAVHHPMYRVMIMAMYAAGLRIFETCRLRVADIDSRRMIIRILGKGDKERLTVLSKRLLEELRCYWRAARPEADWLFPGKTEPGHVSTEAVRTAFRKAAHQAGIDKKATPHSLRHSFASHLIECDVDVTVVAALLGHASLRATQVYTHVSVAHIAKTQSPLDVLIAAKPGLLE